MGYSITINVTPLEAKSYIFSDPTNPTTIDAGETVELKFSADSVFYILLKNQASAVAVSGAQILSWECAAPYSEAILTIGNATNNVIINLAARQKISPIVMSSPFKLNAQAPIETRFVLTKQQMLEMLDTSEPDIYFAVCKDDRRFYIYDKTFSSIETGKFRPLDNFLLFDSAEAKQHFNDALTNAASFISLADKVDKIRVNHKAPVIIDGHNNGLFEIEYEDFDYEAGTAYMDQFEPEELACSVFRSGNLIGRNLDFPCTNHPNFNVITAAVNNRHATIGGVVAPGAITEEAARSGVELEEYKYLPFLVADIINDHKVYCSINFVPAGDKGITRGTNPGQSRICQLMLPRYIGDFADSAEHAMQLLNELDIFAPIGKINEECHLFICDPINTYLVEFIDDEMVIFSNTDDAYLPIPNDKAILTNFYLHGWDGSCKTVAGGFTEEAVRETGLTDHACGIERYKLMLSNVTDTMSELDCKNLLSDLRYTKAYDRATTPYRYSDFNNYTAAFGNLTVYSPAEAFQDITTYEIDRYLEGERDGSYWITAHSCIYDINDCMLTMYTNEDFTHPYQYRLNERGVVDRYIPLSDAEIHDICN